MGPFRIAALRFQRADQLLSSDVREKTDFKRRKQQVQGFTGTIITANQISWILLEISITRPLGPLLGYLIGASEKVRGRIDG